MKSVVSQKSINLAKELIDLVECEKREEEILIYDVIMENKESLAKEWRGCNEPMEDFEKKLEKTADFLQRKSDGLKVRE